MNERTKLRHAVNLFFGIALPLACLRYDPIVFRAEIGSGFLSKYLVVGYLASGIGFVSILSWTLIRLAPAFHAGLLLGGALFAAGLGLALLPLSLLTVFIGIGLLGFTPLLTAWAFGREAKVAARSVPRSPLAMLALVGGMLVSCGAPWAAHFHVRSVVRDEIANAAMGRDPSAEAKFLGRQLPASTFDDFVAARQNSTDPERWEALGETYEAITGKPLVNRITALD